MKLNNISISISTMTLCLFMVSSLFAQEGKKLAKAEANEKPQLHGAF